MKKIVLTLAVLALISCGSQQAATENTMTNEKAHVRENIPDKHRANTSPLMAKGNISLEEVQATTWFKRTHEAFQPDAEALEAFQKAMKKHDYKIDVYFGLWCGDSHREVPKLIKLMEMAEIDLSRLTFVSVDRSKRVPDVSPEIAEKLNIHHVPTFIFYKEGEEVERFVERPVESLEKDLAKIAQGEAYSDRYGG